MNVTTDRTKDVAIVRVHEGRLMYPLLSSDRKSTRLNSSH